ncbi:MAG: hypothetical protein WA705_21865 [Candidatus Ozemobacteraceae bacterium]
MIRLAQLFLVTLMVGMLVPAFAFDTTGFTKVLQTAVNADEYLFSLMEPGMPKNSPEFQAALAAQKTARSAIAQEINALNTQEALEQALVIAKSFSAQSGAAREIGRLAQSLISGQLRFVGLHEVKAGH